MRTLASSWQGRNQQRGGISSIEFMAELDRLGFIEIIPPRFGALHEFEHPDSGVRRYVVFMREGSYTRSLDRIARELDAHRQWHQR